ncbi:MAG TPA: 1,2-phenylacetyl-CoA epoxidase subunit PaaC [Puia sp.]|jgi:ring-1,2-phenylacetyl-CoA epoxidase subunit PaaC|nr:1,2-phenylacetyl-CoA epoxidase subunit PaaC [Puia sp.]
MAFPAHIDYVLQLADNALILGHRNSEWTGHGPILEQDIALSNIALDLIGQARYLYQHAAQLIGGEVTEDRLAYGRDAWDFRNCLLVEQANGDWGKTVMRQFLCSAWQYYLYKQLQGSQDRELAAIAEKSVKEVTYHLRWSGEWVIRLGDGTEESHGRMQGAVDQLWKYTGELFIPAAGEAALIAAGVAVDPEAIRGPWEEKVGEIFGEAGLTADAGTWMQTGGKDGRHTEHLGYLLAEMQFLQRAYPNCEW